MASPMLHKHSFHTIEMSMEFAELSNQMCTEFRETSSPMLTDKRSCNLTPALTAFETRQERRATI